ncbi:MAG: hypothetical protein ACTTK1_04265, partial [Candidatus Cryptobacteroides sp.]
NTASTSTTPSLTHKPYLIVIPQHIQRIDDIVYKARNHPLSTRAFHSAKIIISARMQIHLKIANTEKHVALTIGKNIIYYCVLHLI